MNHDSTKPRVTKIEKGIYPAIIVSYILLVVLIVGLADTYTGHAPCFDLAGALRAGGSEVEVFGLPGAMHGWDSGAGRWSHPSGVSYADCRFVEIAPGR